MPEWSVSIEDDLVVWRFPEDMDGDVFAGDELFERWREILLEENPKRVVIVTRVDDPFSREAFEQWVKAARLGYDHGLERGAVVATGIKRMSLMGQLDNVPGLDLCITEDEEEAFEWIRSDE